ncbi:MAG: thiamine phosphate synthase [Planctomycetes bacterium]|nr:thiamine phosphate synthase [Planctomycetota bacterium]
MSFQYTPAADRALHAAAAWDDPDFRSDIAPPALLLGLLEQPECRAAKLLEHRGINEAAVLAFRPGLERRGDPESLDKRVFLSRGVEDGLRTALEMLDENPRTCQIATEHILLGLATANDTTGSWLREQGIDPAVMESEICARYGIDHSPIPFDWTDAPIPLAEQVTAAVIHDEEPAPMVDCQMGLLRVLDAAANRAGEAVRVVEDYARFVLNDAGLTKECKELRHELTTALSAVSHADRLAARDTVGDVGTEIATEAEGKRADVEDVAAANLRRLQESLRSLEEFGKVLDPALGRACEKLRYRSYTLQKQFAARVGATSFQPKSPDLRARLETARLYVLIDGGESEGAMVRRVLDLVAAGVDVVQLRDKKLDDRTLLARAKLLREATRGSQTLFIMNDRPDLALLADADGVHVGQDELTVAEARAIVGGERLVGVSTHSIDQARRAVADGADYIGVGPTFPSGTKQFAEFPGLDFVHAVSREISLPAFAIGGITAENLPQVRAAGLSRVAVSGAVQHAEDVSAVVAQMRQALA